MEFRNLSFRIQEIGSGILRMTLTGDGEASEVIERSRLETLLSCRSRSCDEGATDLARNVSRRVQPAPELQEESGAKLFDMLFRGQIRELFCSQLGSVEKAGFCLRLSLALDISQPAIRQFQQLQWETLWFSGWGTFLALDRRISLVRSLAVPRPAALTPALETIGCLVACATPRDVDKLDVAGELERIGFALKGQSRIQPNYLESANARSIRDRLLEQPSQILHFAGHGYDDEQLGLILEGENREPLFMAASRWAEQMAGLHLRLVILNACSTAATLEDDPPFQGVAQALIRAGLPAVVAMREPILDAASLIFAQVFYSRLAQGESVDTAITESRLALRERFPDKDAWSLPTVFLAGADGCLFGEKLPSESPAAATDSFTEVSIEMGRLGSRNEVTGIDEIATERLVGRQRVGLKIQDIKNGNKIAGIVRRRG